MAKSEYGRRCTSMLIDVMAYSVFLSFRLERIRTSYLNILTNNLNYTTTTERQGSYNTISITENLCI